VKRRKLSPESKARLLAAQQARWRLTNPGAAPSSPPALLVPPVANMSFSLAYWAKLKNVSEATVRRLVKTGHLRAIRIGGQLRIYEADWARYEVRQETSSAVV
jgi:excisionase family DNA binding protein